MAMGLYGAKLLFDGDLVMTHCNAGALATSAYGTALGIIRAAKEAGKTVKLSQRRPVQSCKVQGLRHLNFDMTTLMLR